MHVILLALGLVIALAGLALIGLGIPNNTTAPGSTFIVSGTVALVGGLVLTGLASAIRQLRRIAQLLEARPVPRALGPDPEPVRIPAVTPAVEPSVEAEPERGPPPVAAVSERPPAAVEDRSPRIDAPSLRASSEEVSIPNPVEHERAAPVPEPVREERTTPPPPPPTAPARMTFDTTWADARSAQAPRETLREAPRERPSAPAPSAHGSLGSNLRGTAEPAHGVHIFKSGVIDGMAYTLYTDGSIEAELAQGTVKFASVDELRSYLAAREQ
jgi:hypothetical protein